MDAGRVVVYPVTLAAAISVIIFSLLCIAVMTGFLPIAQSQKKADSAKGTASKSAMIADVMRPRLEQSGACSECAVVESIRVREVRGNSIAPGAAAGGAAGGLSDNQAANGRTAVVAASGVYAGNNVEKAAKKKTYNIVRLRMKDGTYRIIFDLSQPRVTVGERVQLTNGTIVRLTNDAIAASGERQLPNP